VPFLRSTRVRQARADPAPSTENLIAQSWADHGSRGVGRVRFIGSKDGARSRATLGAFPADAGAAGRSEVPVQARGLAGEPGGIQARVSPPDSTPVPPCRKAGWFDRRAGRGTQLDCAELQVAKRGQATVGSQARPPLRIDGRLPRVDAGSLGGIRFARCKLDCAELGRPTRAAASREPIAANRPRRSGAARSGADRSKGPVRDESSQPNGAQLSR
jgi:hypothetical protein